MQIIRLEFEKKLFIDIRGERVEIVLFQTQEPGNIKVGIEAPRSMRVNREEIQNQVKKKMGLDP